MYTTFNSKGNLYCAKDNLYIQMPINADAVMPMSKDRCRDFQITNLE